MPSIVTIESEYLYTVFNYGQTQQRINDICQFLRSKYRRSQEKPTIAFRGLSGCLIAPIVAYRLKYPMFVVRKNEKSHSSNIMEGNVSFNNYIIIDDFVATGKTINDIKKAAKKCNKNAKLEGIILYNSYDRISDHKNFCRKFQCWIKNVNKGYEAYVKL